MRFRFVLAALLLISALLSAQTPERIKADPAWIWAEGRGETPSSADQAALSALVVKLAATEELPLPGSVREAVWKTYLSDIRNNSESLFSPPGLVLRYLAWRDIPGIFESRRRKVQELVQSAEQAVRQGESDAARTYCGWAEVYLSSLPDGEAALRRDVSSLRSRLGNGPEAQLHIRNIETEVAAIRRALMAEDNEPAPGPLTQTHPALISTKRDAPSYTNSREPLELLPSMELVTTGAEQKNLLSLTNPVRLENALSIEPEPVTPAWTWTVSAIAELGRIPAFGLMAAGSVGHWGGYITFRSNYVGNGSDYPCTSEGMTDWGYIWVSGVTRTSRMSLGGGVLYRPRDPFGFYGGVGYGQGTVLWEDTAGKWASVSDLSHAGLLLDIGMQLCLGSISVTAGASSILLRDWSAVIGLGWRFSGRGK